MKRVQGQLELPVISHSRDRQEAKAEPRGSIFNLPVCVWYAAQRRLKGTRIQTLRGYGKYLFKTGQQDEEIAIEIALNPEYWPILLRLINLDRRKPETAIPR
jgi:hypothetical protein